jgi:hypothetical protein
MCSVTAGARTGRQATELQKNSRTVASPEMGKRQTYQRIAKCLQDTETIIAQAQFSGFSSAALLTARYVHT